MCGIAGIIDLTAKRPTPVGALEAMAAALYHRGPDEDGFLVRPGLGLASRRLSIVGLHDGRQPIFNEDRSIAVVYNGELFDYPERRRELERRGHQFSTHCDTELIPHYWEDHQEGTLERLRGQFALALWEERQRTLTLARDRFGICPLYWTRQRTDSGEWLLFASEIKALLATGLVVPEPDPRGLNHAFSFFALPGPVTCFQGVRLLPPGHYLTVKTSSHPEQPAQVTERAFWEMDFPDRGDEDPGQDSGSVVDGFERVLLQAVRKRLRADVPVVSYLSGGVDSGIVVALACHVRGDPIPTFTIQIKDPSLDEANEALQIARHVRATPVVVGCGPDDVLGTYPRLIHAAEGPVIDTACAALLLLAQEVHAHGYKVAVTGEGSDEWLAGYPWYKANRRLGYLDLVPGLRLGQWARKMYARMIAPPRFHPAMMQPVEEAAGGPNAWLDIYGLMSLSKFRFFSDDLLATVRKEFAYDGLLPNRERSKRWHPLHRELYFGARIQLAGLLLNAKGDRVAMHSSVETRYPFLDEDVFAYLAGLHPRWKLRGLQDKYVLRLLAERWLPHEAAWRKKAMFRAPFDSFYREPAPAYVEQLLSDESLRRTGFFDANAVNYWRQAFRNMRAGAAARATLEMGLVGVVGTQLWYHTFIDGSLADLPSDASLWRGARDYPDAKSTNSAVPATQGGV
jgi:asparagine synthase (glutamine-hydrolysing)